MNKLIKEERGITLSEVAAMVNISHGSAHVIVHDDLGYYKVCARWVPKQLTLEHKQRREEVARQFLQRYEEDTSILERIVTGDETWVHHYEPESKRQRKEWRHPSSPTPKKFKPQPSCKKLMLTLFWDTRGPVFNELIRKKI